jgi:2,4-dienoyl-CoA reductase-like NADH-dependent reductase (Old Yellow Enzyme family)
MSDGTITRLASLKSVDAFKEHQRALNIHIPCDQEMVTGEDSIVRRPISRGRFQIRNRIAVQPMEGWDGTADGKPSEHTIRRWRRFGRSGAGLIWGGEAAAVCHAGRANPNQLVIADHTLRGLEQLRNVLIEDYRALTGSIDAPVIGLQLTHSGRYCKPNVQNRNEPQILYHHPILDKRLGLSAEYPVLSDAEIERIIGDFHRAAVAAAKLGFDFVDIKHCHGYLGHEFLSAHTRAGRYGGSFENRTRFLREIVEGIRTVAPELELGVRLSAFDSVPFRPDPRQSVAGRLGPGIPEQYDGFAPYQYGFGVDAQDPREMDLTETIRFVALLEELGIRLVNLTAGSPYYNPHIQRPALYPPSDGYQPPEDPLIGVARQMEAARQIKAQFPNLIFVGTAYSYLQEYLPLVAQAAIREEWTDIVGLGRMILSYPEILWDASEGRALQRKKICRTFSDCTTAPRKGLPSGCYPLDPYYKNSPMAEKLDFAKGVPPKKPQSV